MDVFFFSHISVSLSFSIPFSIPLSKINSKHTQIFGGRLKKKFLLLIAITQQALKNSLKTQSSIQMCTLLMKSLITMDKVNGERIPRISRETHCLQTLPVNYLHQGIWRFLKSSECRQFEKEYLELLTCLNFEDNSTSER